MKTYRYEYYILKDGTKHYHHINIRGWNRFTALNIGWLHIRNLKAYNKHQIHITEIKKVQMIKYKRRK